MFRSTNKVINTFLIYLNIYLSYEKIIISFRNRKKKTFFNVNKINEITIFFV